MKAAFYSRYGPPEVVQIKGVPTPEPRARQVLVRVVATTMTRGDVIMRGMLLPEALPGWQKLFSRLYLGVTKPRRPVLGMELSGVVEQIGSRVTRFQVGDAVFGSTFKIGFGAHAEYRCLPETAWLWLKPDSVDFVQAACVPSAGVTALKLVQSGQIVPGHRVLIYGASGALGTYAVQLAKHFGAQVTGVCSGPNAELIKSIGASQAIDYTQTDFRENGERYDVVFDMVGKLDAPPDERSLAPGGRFISVMNHSTNLKNRDFDLLVDLVAQGAVRPVVDRVFSFADIVEAHRYVEQGHKKGNVAIAVAEVE